MCICLCLFVNVIDVCMAYDRVALHQSLGMYMRALPLSVCLDMYMHALSVCFCVCACHLSRSHTMEVIGVFVFSVHACMKGDALQG